MNLLDIVIWPFTCIIIAAIIRNTVIRHKNFWRFRINTYKDELED